MLSFSFYIHIAQKALGQENMKSSCQDLSANTTTSFELGAQRLSAIPTWELRDGQLHALQGHFSQSFFWNGTAIAGR